MAREELETPVDQRPNLDGPLLICSVADADAALGGKEARTR